MSPNISATYSASSLTDGELEGSVFEGRFCRPEDDRVPLHDVVVTRRSAHPGWWVLLEKTEARVYFLHKQKVFKLKMTPIEII